MTDAEFIDLLKAMAAKSGAPGFIGTTWFVAMRAGTTTAAARRRLIKLEKAGHVRRVEKYCGPNSLAWALPS